MGGETTPSRAVVQSAGYGYRLRASVLKQEFEPGGELQHLLLRYTQALITQMAQTAVCNRHHSVEQQLCRWLLLSLDRLPSNELTMTQELIANMLGVRREGVTEAAGKLQAAGIDPLQPRQDHRAGPSQAGSAGLRVLCGGQTRIRSPGFLQEDYRRLTFMSRDHAQSSTRSGCRAATHHRTAERQGNCTRSSIENSLLAAVPRKEYQRLLAGLEPVTLTFGEILYGNRGETIRHVLPNR